MKSLLRPGVACLCWVTSKSLVSMMLGGALCPTDFTDRLISALEGKGRRFEQKIVIPRTLKVVSIFRDSAPFLAIWTSILKNTSRLPHDTEEMPVPRGAVQCTEYHLAIPADKLTADFLPALQERATTSQLVVLYLKDAFSRAFTKCCKETGFLMVVKCRKENTALKDCLVGYYTDPSFNEECKAEYLKQREEYRATGIKKKRQKITSNV